MRTGDLKQVILKLFGNREFYGYEVHKVLVSEDVKVEISRLYRVLNEMRREELLESRWEKSQMGPRKRVYQLGKKGKDELNNILVDAIKTVHGFYGAYLMNLPPKINVLHGIIRLLTDGMMGDETIVYIATKFSPMHAMIIYNLQRKIPQGTTFLVKPKSLDLEIKIDNLVSLDGAYSDVLLKDGNANLLVVMDLPEKDILEKALREWHRIISKNGKLVIITPTILVHRYEDPLTIGDFVEKYEHETIEKSEPIDRDFLQILLKKYFKNVEEKQIVHMTFFLVSKPQILS
jgi:PadR family transcriptional regulator PadR